MVPTAFYSNTKFNSFVNFAYEAEIVLSNHNRHLKNSFGEVRKCIIYCEGELCGDALLN